MWACFNLGPTPSSPTSNSDTTCRIDCLLSIFLVHHHLKICLYSVRLFDEYLSLVHHLLFRQAFLLRVLHEQFGGCEVFRRVLLGDFKQQRPFLGFAVEVEAIRLRRCWHDLDVTERSRRHHRGAGKHR